MIFHPLSMSAVTSNAWRVSRRLGAIQMALTNSAVLTTSSSGVWADIAYQSGALRMTVDEGLEVLATTLEDRVRQVSHAK